MANISDIVNSRTNQVELQATRTNWVDNSVLDIIGASSGFTPSPPTGDVTAFARASRDSNGQYSLEFTVKYTKASSDSTRFTFTGVNLDSSSHEWLGIAASTPNASIRNYYAVVENSGDRIVAQWDGAVSLVSMSGTVPLTGKPTWFDDNLMTSGGLPVATANSYGVVKQNQWAVKTFNGSFISNGTRILKFDNLQPGLVYEYKVYGDVQGNTGSETTVSATFELISNNNLLPGYNTLLTENKQAGEKGAWAFYAIFQATDTLGDIEVAIPVSGGQTIRGTAILTERHDLVGTETTIYD